MVGCCVCVCVLLLFVRVTGGRLLCVCATAVCQSNWW